MTRIGDEIFRILKAILHASGFENSINAGFVLIESIENGNARLNGEVLAEFPGIAQLEIEGLEPSQPLLALGRQSNLRQISANALQLLDGEQAIVNKRLSRRC